ncbi:hypothetical protein KY290_027845 [Solanum tuberosum]|uniref:Integrase catalytic domain-containing protein n=1 Tax=Solanum tuberosum TaxID=4113 RepID=A0ABQ7UI06_SOLTU|nr:hypothetical protein KY290_027845 [Solanum tuberosum]
MSENGTAANIPVSENVSATVENNSTVSIGDLQHSASTGSCSLTFTGISYSFITNVSDKLSPTWVVDSGATDHMTSLSHLFISYSPCPSYKKITIADGSVITVAGQGDIPLGKSLILKNVLHIPKLSANLISIQKLTKDSKCQVTFFPSYCLFQEQNTKEMIGRASEKGGLYCLDFHNGEYISKNSLSSSFLSESIMSNKEKVWLYHRRLGHPSFYVIKRMFPSLFKDLIVESFHCDDCEIAKHKRTSFPISHKRCQTPFSLIHSDIWGPSPIPNISGARWFVSFIVDCTRVTWIYLLKQKSDVSQILPTFFNMIKTQYDVPIKRFRSDDAKDYFNQNLSVFFQKEGIIHESSCVNTPQQNGIAERRNGLLLDITRSLLFHKKVPKQYWGEAVLTAAHLSNKMPSRILNFQSPLDTLRNFFPNFEISNKLVPRIFGSVAYVHIHSQNRGKLDPRALKCVFIGYSPTQKGYKCYQPSSKKFFVSTDVTFDESESFFNHSYNQGESLNGKEPLDLSLFDLSISSRAKSLPESPFLQSPESLNPNEPIESPNPNIDNGILENNLPLQVYSRRKGLTDQTTQLQSSPQVTAPDTHPEPVEPSETPN